MRVNSTKEAIDYYEQGIITRGETYPLFLSLITFENVDDVVSEIPEPYQTNFIDWAREHYPKDLKMEDLVHIGGESTRYLPDDAIFAIQDWIERHPESMRT